MNFITLAIRIDLPQCGQSEHEVVEHQADFDYMSMENYLQSTHTNQQKETLTKAKLRELLAFAQTKREKELLKYAAIKASGLSQQQRQERI